MAAHVGRRGFLRNIGGGAAALSAIAWLPRSAQATSAMGFEEARHLLSRTALGATPSEILGAQALDYAVAVDHLLGKVRVQAATPAPAWVNEGPSFLRQQARAQADKAGVEAKPVQIVQKRVMEQGRELRSWWVTEMLSTDQPLVERMTLFWHNHFTSSIQKVRFVPSMYWQNVLFRREALGNFATLLREVARDPAMLIYLDGVRSVARQPNENFARELLELFTLGEGHYTEADIRNAARAFTGWSIDRETGRFQNHAQLHDDGVKTFLGETGRFTGEDIVNILLRRPRTAETIVEKLWREFVSLKPEVGEVKRLAAIFRDSGYEMKPLLRALFLSPAFRDPANRAALIKSPVELIVGSVRMLGLPVPEKTQLVRMMGALGQILFSPPNVKGWPGGESWITTNTLLLRQQFLRRIIEATTVSPMEGGSMMAAGAGRRMDRREQLPVEGRSLRNSAGEVRLGPTLAGVDGATLRRTLLARVPIDGVDAGDPPGEVVAAAMLDPAYQLK
jgi:uncharacterized protein (DUF1800 family)